MVVVLKNCANILLESSLSSTGPTTSRTPTPKLQLVARCVEQLYKTYRRSSYGDLKRICLDYRLYICQETSKSGATGCSGAYSSFPLTTKRVIHFWAFSGGIAMEELKGLGIKSFILTSGAVPQLFYSDSSIEYIFIPCCIRHVGSNGFIQRRYETSL